jgi:hypothetical protein
MGVQEGNLSGFELGQMIGNSSGYQDGYESGNYSGCQLGYTVGYLDGNSSGYIIGYEKGYAQGNSSGYENGYSNGSSNGYEHGYEVGYSEGNSTGHLVGFADGNKTGYEKGYLEGVADGAGRGYNIRDPTYQEALDFISSDETDEHEYSDPDYVCWNYATDFANNAFNAGYRCGWVYLELAESAHAIVCFNTTDRGLVYIEPQDDSMVVLNIGQPYWDRQKYSPTYDDTIIRFTIIW